jgi:hypothetical protein
MVDNYLARPLSTIGTNCRNALLKHQINEFVSAVISKRGVAKQKHDIRRMNSLVEIEQNEYKTILSLNEQEKRRMLDCDAL